MVVIPTHALSDDALLGVIDAFILREGTDYGHTDYSLDEKRERVRKLLAAGKAQILFYPETDFIDIQFV